MLMVICYITTILYFQPLVKYFGHLLLVAILWGYSSLDSFVEDTIKERPTLDDIVHVISCVYTKADLLLSPLSVWTGNDIKRMLLTMAFLSPVYVVISLFIVSSQKLVLIGGIYILTYHSSWSRVTRRLLWKIKVVRLLLFYVTGLDLSGVSKHQGGIFAAVHKKVKKLSSNSADGDEDGTPIRFTYVLYENQRRWLGIGWTSNMLTYERSSWTDEFLNEAPSPEQFRLPEETSEMAWRWVDKTWRLDMTNDGAIQLSSSRPKTTASPGGDDGFIYYDNTWKKPSTDDSFSKYTRRRRWIRTAELIKVGSLPSATTSTTTTTSASDMPSAELNKNSTSEQESKSGDENSKNGGSDDADSSFADEMSDRKVSFSETKDVRIISDDDYRDSEVIRESLNEDFQAKEKAGELKGRTDTGVLKSADTETATVSDIKISKEEKT